MDKQTALDLLDEKQDFLFSVSDSIWDNPETDYTETVSSGILMDALKKEGFTVTSGLAGIPTAFFRILWQRLSGDRDPGRV